MQAKRFPIATFLACSILFALQAPAFAAPPLYRVTDLGDLPGGNSQSIAYGLNDAGDVVGSGFSSAGFGPEAILWSGGSITNLGDLVGGTTRSEAFAINELGVIAGIGASAVASDRAVTWTGGVILDLGDLPGGSPQATALDVNDAGRVVGVSGGSPTLLSTLWNGGSIDELGIPAGTGLFAAGSRANAINVLGEIVGQAAIGSGGGVRALKWSSDGSTVEDLGALYPAQRDIAQANDINDLGQIVGYTGITGSIRAARWSSGIITDLGDLPGGPDSSEARAINNGGQIVGVSSVAATTHAFLWEEGVLYDLNDLLDPSDPLSAQTTLLEAFDINASGQIVGRAQFAGVLHAFLLTPIAPAPLTLAPLLMVVLLWVGAFALRRQRV